MPRRALVPLWRSSKALAPHATLKNPKSPSVEPLRSIARASSELSPLVVRALNSRCGLLLLDNKEREVRCGVAW